MNTLYLMFDLKQALLARFITLQAILPIRCWNIYINEIFLSSSNPAHMIKLCSSHLEHCSESPGLADLLIVATFK